MNSKLNELIKKEYHRQQSTLSLIPSENYVSQAVQQAQASCFTNKYAEGYPGKRYYGGAEFADQLERLCQEQAQKVFKTDYFVNVQPYSGSPANLAVYLGLLEPGDTIMGMALTSGGHLTHGHSVSITGKLFKSVAYEVDPETHFLDYDTIQVLAAEHRPKLIIAGATAYSRTIDFARFSQIAQSIGAYLLADIAHISGLVATGLHPSPIGYADVVTTTTHKMLRGPRGALIFSRNEEIAQKINKALFPGLQGGPHLHTIAAITQCLYEAQEANYKSYCQQILDNAQAMVKVLQSCGFEVITGGTDNHLWLIDMRNKNMTGKEAQEKLEAAGMVANKNTIPFDPSKPFTPSGIRMGTPAITTRGFSVTESQQLAQVIADLLTGKTIDTGLIAELTKQFPIPTRQII